MAPTLVMNMGLHTRTGLRVWVSRAQVRVSKLLPIGKPAPMTRVCGFGRQSFKKLVIDILFSVFVVNDNNAATATPSLTNASPGGFFFLSTKEVRGVRTKFECLASSMTTLYVLFCSLFYFTNFFFFLLLDDDDDHHRCCLLITS